MMKERRIPYLLTARLVALLLAAALSVLMSPPAADAGGWQWSTGERLLGPRIVNGVGTSEVPSVGLLLGANSACTGTLIGCRTFLTAAHCVEDDPSPDAYGVFFQHQGLQQVMAVTIHPDWTGEVGSGHDLALLRLSAPVDGIAPLPINTVSSVPFGTEGLMVGFGSRGTDSPSGLKVAGFNLTESCSPRDDQLLLCSVLGLPTGPVGLDSLTCQGDSGGPLVVEGPGDNVFIAGVASFIVGGAGSCLPPYGAAWAQVFADRAWIQSVAGADLGNTACGPLPAAGSPRAPFVHGAGELSVAEDGDDLDPLNVPSGTAALVITLNGELTADFDLFLRHGAPATATLNDCSSESFLNLESCVVANPAAGAWHVRVGRFGGAGEYQLTATLFANPNAGGSACTPDDTTLCLVDDRFSVTLDFTRPGNPTERARVEQREDQWGTFAFFAGSNIPNAMVTMGRRPNGFFAVQVPPLQAAALEVTIFDHQTETSKSYGKEQGNLELILDPAAFPQ